MKRTICLLAALCLLLSGCSFGALEDVYSTAKTKLSPEKNDTWKEYFEAGTAYMEDEKYPEAIEAFSNAIDFDPDRGEAYLSRGDAYTKAAEELLKKPSGTIMDRYNDKTKASEYVDNARKDYEKAWELEPDWQEVITEKIEHLDAVDTGPIDEVVIVDPAAELENLIGKLDYAMIIGAYQEMGASGEWDVFDMDGDGYFELAMDFSVPDSMYDWYASTKIVVDGGTRTSQYYSADGVAYVPLFRLGENETLYLESWDYSGSNSNCTTYCWDGMQWSESNAVGMEEPILTCPDLSYFTTEVGFNAACAALESAYMGRDQFQGYVDADFDSDGNTERVFLLLGATNSYFQNMTALHTRGEEMFPSYYFDFQVTAVVVSTQGSGTSIRMARLDTNTCFDVSTDGNCLVLDGIRYSYSSEGIPFSAGEMVIAGNIVDTTIFQIALPDDWMKGTTWYIDEAWDSEGACREFCVSFYEKSEYEDSWRGHLFTLVTTLEAEVPYPDADYIGILYLGSPADTWCPVYNVYAVYPTDVQYTSETCDTYIALSADIPTILRGLEAQDGCYFQSYYNN